jgi:hypothetical protein
MSKLNFAIEAPTTRDIGGAPSWLLVLTAIVLVAFVAVLLAPN